MKRNAFFGLLVILLVFGVVGCATVEVALTPTENFKDPGIVLAGDAIGNLSYVGSTAQWIFFLTAGDGDTDNNLFEIKKNNILTAKRKLLAREYSVRVKMLGPAQDAEESSGIQKIFTFIVTKDPPRPVYGNKDAITVLEGTWSANLGSESYEFSGDIWRIFWGMGLEEMGTFTINGSSVTLTYREKTLDGGQIWDDYVADDETYNFTFALEGTALQLVGKELNGWYRKQ